MRKPGSVGDIEAEAGRLILRPPSALRNHRVRRECLQRRQRDVVRESPIRVAGGAPSQEADCDAKDSGGMACAKWRSR